MKITVIGLGWMGLPIAALFAEGGNQVTGLDINQKLVDEINSGDNHRKEENLTETLQKHKIHATTDYTTLKDSDVISIIVPLIINKDKSLDFNPIKKALEETSKHMKEHALILIHTTMPIGATRNIIKPIIDQTNKKYHLAYSPIRAASGTALKDMKTNYPRILGAIDAQSMEKAKAALETFFENKIIELPLEEAEATKIFEVTYRDTNIALANELALISKEKGLDYQLIKNAANTCHYYHLHDAGIGVGGHCLPVYPYLILNNTKADKGLIRLARKINDFMPEHAIDILLKTKPELKTVTVYGIAYRPETSEHRYSPAITLTEKLKEKGIEVLVCDPWIDDKTLSKWGKPVSLKQGLNSDALVFTVAHQEFKTLEEEIPENTIVLDGRRIFNKKNIKAKYLAI
ncbi:nucleotide sugar dehydrogenase [archaeon]|nr:nucleotide sugar dehydrogenase [archaeon]